MTKKRRAEALPQAEGRIRLPLSVQLAAFYRAFPNASIVRTDFDDLTINDALVRLQLVFILFRKAKGTSFGTEAP